MLALVAVTVRAEEPAELPPEYLVEERDGFAFAYHPSTRARVRRMVERAPAIREELRTRLGAAVLASVRVRVGVHAVDLARVLPEGRAPSLAAPLVEPSSSTVALALPEDVGDARADAAFRGGLAALALEEAAATAVPAWFRDGFVDRFAVPTSLGRLAALADAALSGAPARLDEPARASLPSPPPGPGARDPSPRTSWFAAERSALVEEVGLPQLLAATRTGLPFAAALRDVGLGERELTLRIEERLGQLRVGLLAALGTLAALLGAIVARRARKPTSRDRRAERVEFAPALASGSEPTTAARRAAALRDVPPYVPRRYEPGLPKVSHDGRWHTLH